jgi:hypothetical protein
LSTDDRARGQDQQRLVRYRLEHRRHQMQQDTRKAPTAARKLGTPAVEAIKAAPGVDQAVMIGMR